jgi:DNA-binding SARP family transcriptional activator
VDFRILGPLEVWEGDRAIVVRGAKQRALLAVLLLNANEVVSMDRLIDLLWGENPPEAGAAALRVRVSQLRKALGKGGEAIVTQAPGYVLRVDEEHLDLRRFERLVGQAVDVSPEDAADQLRRALVLWRGAALAEFAYEDFAQTAIARLEELRLSVTEMRIDADLALGRHRDVIAELEALVDEYPLREAPARQLMLALYRAGRQADALAVYRSCRAKLVDDLGIEPTPTLQALEKAILQHDPVLDHEVAAPPERSILVAPFDPAHFDDLVAIAESLARRPPRELIVAQLIGSASELAAASALPPERREVLRSKGVAARSAAFTSERPGADLVRIASEQDVDLLLVEAPPTFLDDPVVQAVLLAAPCDVGLLAPRSDGVGPGAILVPFTGAEHDWAAVEIAAWIARSLGASLRLAGPSQTDRDSSRLLARASLAVQRALGVEAEPSLVQAGAAGLLAAVDDAGLVVVGLPDDWRRAGLGDVRGRLVSDASPPVLVVRRGLRPGGLTPPEGLTRFTWSIAAR